MKVGAVNEWKQAGATFFWRYTRNLRNYPGWHLATDAAGHRSMLDLLRRVSATGIEPHVSRTLRLTAPSPEVLAIPNNRRSPVVAPARLRLLLADDPEQWTVEEV